MDPDQILEEIRATCARVLDRNDTGADHADTVALLIELTERARDLDQWLTSGGFLPAPWEKHWRGMST